MSGQSAMLPATPAEGRQVHVGKLPRFVTEPETHGQNSWSLRSIAASLASEDSQPVYLTNALLQQPGQRNRYEFAGEEAELPGGMCTLGTWMLPLPRHMRRRSASGAR